MPWFAFERAFNWSPPELNGWVTTEYLPGMRCLVTTPCAEAAKAARAGVILKPPGAFTAALMKADPYWRPPDAEAEVAR